MTRNISSLDMPMKLQTSLKNNYAGYWISDLFEISNNDGTNYYITMENADSKIVLKSTSDGNWSVYQKICEIISNHKQLVLVCGKNKPRLSAKKTGF